MDKANWRVGEPVKSSWVSQLAFCPTCNTITLTPKEKGVMRLFTEVEKAFCKKCETMYCPIIVPPTYYKDMSNVFLQTVWNKAERILRVSDLVVFCGYSFPDADMHIKYLIKRAQTNRSTPLRFMVVNQYPEKTQGETDDEKMRYERFLGKVEYSKYSFEEFAQTPVEIMKKVTV